VGPLAGNRAHRLAGLCAVFGGRGRGEARGPGMSLLKDVKSWIGLDPDTPTTGGSRCREGESSIRLREDAWQHPAAGNAAIGLKIRCRLRSSGWELGGGHGWGLSTRRPRRVGPSRVAFCGMDVDLYDVEKGLSLLRSELRRLECPKGTVLLYEAERPRVRAGGPRQGEAPPNKRMKLTRLAAAPGTQRKVPAAWRPRAGNRAHRLAGLCAVFDGPEWRRAC